MVTSSSIVDGGGEKQGGCDSDRLAHAATLPDDPLAGHAHARADHTVCYAGGVALRRGHHIGWLSVLLAPPSLFGLLTVLRPDLIAPMFEGFVGGLALKAIAALTVAGALGALCVLWGVDRLVRPERRGLRLALSVVIGAVPVIHFTVPALFLVVFSPIVHAFAAPAEEELPAHLPRPASDVRPMIKTLP
jgi:hypothetical protein